MWQMQRQKSGSKAEQSRADQMEVETRDPKRRCCSQPAPATAQSGAGETQAGRRGERGRPGWSDEGKTDSVTAAVGWYQSTMPSTARYKHLLV